MQKKIIVFILMLFLSCIFNLDKNTPLIMTQLGNDTNVVSIWPQLTFVFSVPLKDSIVSIVINPDPGPVYNSHLNENRDTLLFSVTGSLEGNTDYILKLKYVLTAINGNKLYPEDVVFNIRTLPSEKEPNNNKLNADTLLTTLYGVIKPANDTDCFYFLNTTATGIYLKSHDKKSGFIITDLIGDTLAIDDGLGELKTYTIPNTIDLPLFIYVFSLFDNAARYELGFVL